MIVYVASELLQIIVKFVTAIVTNDTLQKLFLASFVGMIILDSLGIFTFTDLGRVILDFYIATWKGIIDSIILGVQNAVDSVINWLNNTLAEWLRNQVISV